MIKEGIALSTSGSSTQSTKTTSSKTKTPYEEPAQWRQFNRYHPTCRFNLQHIGKDCKRQRHKDHDEAATWADKKGGQIKRNRL